MFAIELPTWMLHPEAALDREDCEDQNLQASVTYP